MGNRCRKEFIGDVYEDTIPMPDNPPISRFGEDEYSHGHVVRCVERVSQAEYTDDQPQTGDQADSHEWKTEYRGVAGDSGHRECVSARGEQRIPEREENASQANIPPPAGTSPGRRNPVAAYRKTLKRPRRLLRCSVDCLQAVDMMEIPGSKYRRRKYLGGSGGGWGMGMD